MKIIIGYTFLTLIIILIVIAISLNIYILILYAREIIKAWKSKNNKRWML